MTSIQFLWIDSKAENILKLLDGQKIYYSVKKFQPRIFFNEIGKLGIDL